MNPNRSPDVPIDLVLVGKTYIPKLGRNCSGGNNEMEQPTSDASTQDTGPNDREKKMLVIKMTAIPARWAVTCELGMPSTSGGKQATIAVSIV